MPFGIEKIDIVNLKETRKALKALDKDLPKELNKSLKVVAVETADDAKSAAIAAGSTFAHIAPSIRGGASGSNAFVKFGGAKYPEAPGAEFGGGKYTKDNPSPGGGVTSQFRPWRGNKSDAGYAVYPTIRKRQANENPALVEQQIDAFLASNDLN